MLKKYKKGFSFIEVIVALSIFFIFILVFLEIKISFVKIKGKIYDEILYMNLQICIQSTFVKKYTFEQLELLNNKTIYCDTKNLDINTLAGFDLQDYTFEKPQESYIAISINKGTYIEVKSKVYKHKEIKKEFSFVKGRVDEERDIVN